VHLALRPDILLLDITMPLADGWDVLSEVRRRGETPVIVITALDQDLDKLQALRIGADDYVIKPFNPIEVVARVKAVLRRAGGTGASGVLRVGAIEIDTTSHIVLHDGRAIALTLTEFRLLAHMARNPTACSPAAIWSMPACPARTRSTAPSTAISASCAAAGSGRRARHARRRSRRRLSADIAPMKAGISLTRQLWVAMAGLCG
jgi:hypothetical protein